MQGSCGLESRVVVTRPDQAALPLPINLLFVDITAKAQHVAVSHANDRKAVGEGPQVLC